MTEFQLFFQLGLHHILQIGALDHILFLMALIMVFSMHEWKKLLGLVSLFTLAHTGSLLGSVYGFLQVDSSIVEPLILGSIIVTAASNILIRNTEVLHRTHYYFSFFFGLVHGLGFANDIQILIRDAVHKLAALGFFALGIELAQIFLGLLMLSGLWLLYKIPFIQKKKAILILSFLIMVWTIGLFLA